MKSLAPLYTQVEKCSLSLIFLTTPRVLQKRLRCRLTRLVQGGSVDPLTVGCTFLVSWGGQELESNFAPSRCSRLGALDDRRRPGPPRRRACPAPSTCSGGGALERCRPLRCLTYCFPVSARTREGSPTLGGEERSREASSAPVRGWRRVAPAPQESPAHLGALSPPPLDSDRNSGSGRKRRNLTPLIYEPAREGN